MLSPDLRVVLTRELTPDDGWQLDHAVATTFTLGLDAALAAPLGFAAHRLRGSTDPLAVMEAVRGCADRVDVFCQAGNISVPGTPSDLLAFLEPMIHQVREPKPGLLFHPKLWLVRYVSEVGGADSSPEVAYRLLVLSRNLTTDHSWDLRLRLNGVLGTRRNAGNRPLAELLRWLCDGNCVGELPLARAERVRELAEQARRIEWVLPEDVRTLRFHTFGVGPRAAVDFSGTRHLVVSPFIDEGGLRRVAPEKSRSVQLVSRQEELDRLPVSELDRLTAHVLDPLADLANASSAGTGDAGDVLAGLHAKLYLVEYDHTARVLIGSANATTAAFGGNVEILVELEGTKKKLGIEVLLGSEAPFAELLEPYCRVEQPQLADEEERRLDALLRRIAGTPFVIEVHRDANGYRLAVSTQTCMPRWTDTRVTAQLVTRRGEAAELTGGATVEVTFDALGLTQITPFLLVQAESREGRRATVVQGVLVGDPTDRLDEILAKQIDSPEKFLRFLALLLGMTGPSQFPAVDSIEGGIGGWQLAGTGLFELLVRSLVDQPKALEDLGRLVQRMRGTDSGRRIMPEGFDELWARIEDAAGLAGTERTR